MCFNSLSLKVQTKLVAYNIASDSVSSALQFIFHKQPHWDSVQAMGLPKIISAQIFPHLGLFVRLTLLLTLSIQVSLPVFLQNIKYSCNKLYFFSIFVAFWWLVGNTTQGFLVTDGYLMTNLLFSLVRPYHQTPEHINTQGETMRWSTECTSWEIM